MGHKTRRSPGCFAGRSKSRLSCPPWPSGYRRCLYSRVSYPTPHHLPTASAHHARRESEKPAADCRENDGGNDCGGLHEPCSSILSVVWVGDGAVAAVCHINPSLTEYIQTDISTGKNTRDLSGLDFKPSPDGKLIAHVGWSMHFAPPYAESYYLQVDHTTIYPLPKGTKPVRQIGSTEPPKVVQKEGPTYKGIHEFGDMSWSPDSQQIALIDCTYDWTPNRPESLSAADGKASGRRWALAVVSMTGKFVTFPLGETSWQDLGEARISSDNPRELSLELKGHARTFTTP